MQDNNTVLFELYQSTQKTLQIIRDEIRKRDIDWRHLAEAGLTIEAIMKYQKENNCSLTHAKVAVEAFKAE